MSKDKVYCWYAAKVKYQTEKKIKAWLNESSVENFIPFRTVVVERNGKRIKLDKPWVPGLLFIRTDYKRALSLPVEFGITMNYLRNIETHKFLVVPDKQMEDFMFLLDFSETAVRIENTDLKRGDRVRVIKGDFAGIEGELVRIKGHKRVVVRLEGLFSLATTYIPASYLEKI
ncbi:transcriptional regulator [Bacteroidia bacterium]|nr:transcriptional regulator [Bacteroidia bacterium]GHT27006.1 transcriptional regulator [Bacteroidia bacterium]